MGSGRRLVYPLTGTIKLISFLTKLGVLNDKLEIRYSLDGNILHSVKLVK